MAFGLDPCLLALSACRNNRWANWWFEGSMPAGWFMVILFAVPADLIRDAMRVVFSWSLFLVLCYAV